MRGDETCDACGSTNVRRRVFGYPSWETAEEVERDPDLELGGCLITPELWAVKCRDCGYEVSIYGTPPHPHGS